MTIRELAEAIGLPVILDENGNETIGWTRYVGMDIQTDTITIADIFIPDTEKDNNDRTTK